MRVSGIHAPIYTARYQNSTKRIQKTNFKGIFNSTPNISDKFKYGLEALDENSIFIVTSNEERSNMMLENFSDKIDIPVLRKYTLKVFKNDLNDRDEIEADFAIFKKRGEYYVLSLSDHLIKRLKVKKPDEKLNTSEHILPPGGYTKLRSGVAIETGEYISILGKDKDKFIFNPPYSYNPAKAEQYLEVKNITNLNDFNKRTIASLSATNKSNTNPKGLTFSDIGGLDNIIETLRKYVVRPINYPKVFENIRLNKGILLWGPPRCGKTMLGKALANETGAKYSEYNANEFKSAHVGASESMIRDVFQKAEANAPSITFIDEFDSIAKTRDGSSNARFDDPMVNQFLGCMSDLEKSKAPAFIIAATNMKNLIDPALLASGRFGLHIEVPMPNLEGLKQIFKIHSKNQPVEDNIPVEKLVQTMFDKKFNGSDVAEMISDAYFNALERLGLFEKMNNKTFGYDDFNKIKISWSDIIKSIERISKQKI